MSGRGRRSTGPRRLMIVSPSIEYGGMEVHMELLLEYLDRARYTPSFFVPRNPHTPVLPMFVERIRALNVPIVTDRDLHVGRMGSPLDERGWPRRPVAPAAGRSDAHP